MRASTTEEVLFFLRNAGNGKLEERVLKMLLERLGLLLRSSGKIRLESWNLP